MTSLIGIANITLKINAGFTVTNSGRQRTPYQQSVDVSNSKIILLWNSYFKRPDYRVGAFGRETFRRHHCKVDRCSLETDRRLLSKSAAVVFHIRSNLSSFPKHTNYRQLFVYYLKESPHYTYENSYKYRKSFNITMTYRRDSDIPVPMGGFMPTTNMTDKNYTLKYPLSNKQGDVVWLVSHCVTASKRERYVQSLAKHINVDIYGDCGIYQCPRNDTCMKRLEKNYKFYLSFENSYCKDYVTEKYFRTLNYELIPIVYGRANYSEIGPPRAFINILDYRSPKHLANYLRYLSRNETAYLSYFQSRIAWKNVDVLGNAFCRLCELVHNETFYRVYSDVDKWWRRDSCDMETVKRIMSSITE